ncbi:MAG: hypothetical protein D6761_01920 [Candidatus Dadabacteria bacterium]|nr:MAG: hypothetical protein D6761_01920 [Candidatus Dadabacteria bacterium]
MRIDRTEATAVTTTRRRTPTDRTAAVSELLSRELIQRLLPEMPGTKQAGLASEFWVDAIADRLSAQDWLSLRQQDVGVSAAPGAKLFEIAADSHDQQATEGQVQ